MYMNTTGLSGAPQMRPAGARVTRLPSGELQIRVPIAIPGRRRGISGLGAVSASMLVRPGPNGGTEVVDPSGNIIYSESQVSANPGLLSSLGSSVCPGGELPEWYPGGESVCADQSAVVPGEGISPYAQFNYPVDGSCIDGVWCMTGSNPLDPNSYTWTGGGTPTTMNPAIVMGAQPLPASYTSPVSQPAPAAPPAQRPAPPAMPVTAQPIGYGLPLVTTPVPPPATAVGTIPMRPAAVAITNTLRPGQSFQVGDTWQLIVTGSPNQPVVGAAAQDGNSLGQTPYGSTDGNGQAIISGTFDPTTVGNWREVWSVGTSVAPTLSFSVQAAPSKTQAGGAPVPPVAPPAPFDMSAITGFLTTPVSIFGVTVPAWGIGAAAIAALWLLGKRR